MIKLIFIKYIIVNEIDNVPFYLFIDFVDYIQS